ncbi:MAG TPA: Ig-like domain-containing protein, partial [Verrucomicrobiae bacterium]|nr:Ig-like domain-containing protein [Verrucomicrobiae bacterium]
MKAMRSFWGLARVSIGIGSVMFSGTKIFAQTVISNSPIPIVTIRATDPLASWSGNTGTFTVSRSGNQLPTLNVFYNIRGTATNGVDYQTISSFIQLPSGVASSNIVIQPINLGQTNTKTVDLELGPSPLLTPGIPINYRIGVPSNAIVYITPPGVTDIPPVVNITSPTNGSAYTAPADVGLIAVGSDQDGFVTSVEFFAGTNSIGVTTNWVVVDPPYPPGNFVPGSRAFFFNWTNVPSGMYAVTAKATDNGGESSVSPPVEITVGPITKTNIPPVVRITSPQNNAIFRGPLTLPIFAYAHDPDGTIATVEFFDGTNDLGPGHSIGPTPIALPLASGATAYSTPVSPGPIPIPPIPIIPPTNRFVFVWSNAPIGLHVLTAVATDNGGASTTSDPVNIAILPGLPPPTNRPAIVNIVATDPIAIDGTNCWPWLGLANAPTWSNWTAATPLWRVFTNWFPKDAVFTVHRWGDLSDDLTVAYGIGGTASNGVDYVALPGVVTIPAGEISARITIVPLDKVPPEAIKTVVLSLTPDTNLPPDYVLGIPRRAAAIILDGPPWPVTAVLPDKCFHMQTSGPDGA